MPKQLSKNREIKTTQIPHTHTHTQTPQSILQKKSNKLLSQRIIHAWCRHISNRQKRESAYSMSLYKVYRQAEHINTDRNMPVDIGLSLLHPLPSVGTAAAATSRRSSGKGQAAALLLPWIGGGASFMSASQAPHPTAASSSLGEGSTAPCASSAASGLLGPVAVAPPPVLSLAASSPNDCPQQTSHHRRPHRRCPEDRASSPPPAAHPRCRWARAHRCRRGTGGDFLLWRRMLLGSSRVHIIRWCAAAGPNALWIGDGCPWQSLFSICQ
ncbi:hypothetical protein TCDM_10012 [Trypanosoma cruzi Dm28c]|uniref:Uncharacterized protein n=1 Tax=Trypanosoma cruzi Dm28c TaxID=1416333 RepID=V5B3Z4_TRYCR|nr:hypothetical protein TCDM_10012 [Trypanosoma cruzi Dm28c]